MSQVVFLPSSIDDLERLYAFLNEKDPASARKAALVIIQAMNVLQQHPKIGRLVEGLPENYRELIIDFGSTGYIARYYLEIDDVFILAIRHQKEIDK